MRLGKKKRLILKILSEKDNEVYSLDIAEASEGKLKREDIHYYLSTLEDAGLISSRFETMIEHVTTRSHSKKRRLYKITKAGKKMLKSLKDK